MQNFSTFFFITLKRYNEHEEKKMEILSYLKNINQQIFMNVKSGAEILVHFMIVYLLKNVLKFRKNLSRIFTNHVRCLQSKCYA